jgi:tetratricopeptide (TPR) repeat protein
VELAERVMVDRESIRIQAYVSMANTVQWRDLSEAVNFWAKAIDIKRQVLGNHPEVAKLLHRRGCMLVCIGRSAEAVDCLREAYRISETIPDSEVVKEYRRLDDEMVESMPFVMALDLIDTLIDLNRVAEAELEHQRMLERLNRIKYPLATSVVSIATARLELARGEAERAEATARQAISTLQLPYDWTIVVRARRVQAECLIQLNRHADAESILLVAFRQSNRRPLPAIYLAHATAKQLVKIYEALNHPVKVARWQRRMNPVPLEAAEKK